MKFKVRDKVKVINEDMSCANKVGIIKEINEGNEPFYYVDMGDKYPWEIHENDLELYEEQPQSETGMKINELTNNELLCASLFALLLSEDGAKIFKNILEIETCKRQNKD
jgi:hypothetical protein